MAAPATAREIEKREAEAPAGAERTRARRVYVPRVDIYETKEEIILVADMPGVSEKSIDITLDKNVLTLSGTVEPWQPEGLSLTYAEYNVGDYQRVFTLPNEIDREKLQASLKDGVLRLRLPKASAALPRKISVQAA